MKEFAPPAAPVAVSTPMPTRIAAGAALSVKSVIKSKPNTRSLVPIKHLVENMVRWRDLDPEIFAAWR